MKFIKVFSRISEMAFLFWIFAQYLILWLYPDNGDADKIFFFASLIAFEFIMGAAGVAFGAVSIERNWLSFTIFIVFFAIFAAAFTVVTGISSIIWIYVGLVLSRLIHIFVSDTNARELLLGYSALSLMLYFFILILVVTQAEHIPLFGLNEIFFESSNYIESVRVGGIFTEAPHIAMCVGVLYYGIQLLVMLVKTVVKIVK